MNQHHWCNYHKLLLLLQLENPKQNGQPEFITAYEHDAGNINLKSGKVDVLKECK